ncbi:hypothetical protein QUA81_21885 [Microcoleus sp. F6_B4]
MRSSRCDRPGEEYVVFPLDREQVQWRENTCESAIATHSKQ